MHVTTVDRISFVTNSNRKAAVYSYALISCGTEKPLAAVIEE